MKATKSDGTLPHFCSEEGKAIYINKNGTLTNFAFECGYIEDYGNFRLCKDIFKSIKVKEYWVAGWPHNVRVVESFPNVSKARKFAKEANNLLNNQDTTSLFNEREIVVVLFNDLEQKILN